MSFLQKTRVVIMGNLNELVDKVVDVNSIPVLKQYVRDLEDAMASAKHQTAVSAAQVTSLTRDLELAKTDVENDKKRAQAFLAANNEAAARSVAARIADHKHTIESLTAQIETAKQQSESFEKAVETMRTKHDAMLSRVRDLEGKDRMSKSLEQANASIKGINAAMNTGVDASSVDDVARRIDVRNDLAQEEFKRTTSELDGPEDPLKKQAVDDILSELKSTTTTAA